MYTTFFNCCDMNLAFVDKVLRRIFGPKRAEVTGQWEKKNYIMRNLAICTTHQIFFGW